MKTARLPACAAGVALIIWPVSVLAGPQLASSFTFQGYLTDGGVPANGSYDFQFKLYDSPTSGVQVGSTNVMGDVTVTDGVFGVALSFEPEVFDGQNLWLQVEVRPGASTGPYAVLVPREAVTGVPYAIHALSADDADRLDGYHASHFLATSSDYGRSGVAANLYEGSTALTDKYVKKAGDTMSGQLTVNSADLYGIFAEGTGYGVKGEFSGGSLGAGLLGKATGGAGDGVQASSNGRSGVYAWCSGTAGYGLYAVASASGGRAVYGEATHAGTGTNYGGYFTASASSGRGVYARAEGTSGRAVYGYASNSETSLNMGGYFQAEGTTGRGVTGYASNSSGTTNYGGYFTAAGLTGRAVYAYASNSSGTTNYGGRFVAAGTTARAVYGSASNSSGTTNYGGYFTASGSSGVGVYGSASGEQGKGVYGRATFSGAGTTYAGYFECDTSNGTGVYSTSNNGPALHGEVTGSLGWAVRGEAVGAPGGGGGGYFTATATGGTAVKGIASGTGTSIYTRGGWFQSAGSNGYGVYAKATGSSGTAVYAAATGTYGTGLEAHGQQFAATFFGNVRIYDYGTYDIVVELGRGLDYAEGFDVSDKAKIGPGTVVIIDPDSPGKLTVSTRPYDRKVAGIVAGAKGMGSGVRLGTGQFDHDVALAGRVYCNVDATYGAVEPGDLLTTSPTPGYAMKVADHMRAQGAILGKAMEPLPRGKKAQILVLVTLQ